MATVLWCVGAVKATFATFFETLPDSTKHSILVGLCAGVVICVSLALFPGEPFDFEYSDGNRDELKRYKEACAAAAAKGEPEPARPARRADAAAAADAAPPEQPLVINREKLAEKAKKAEQLFGIKAAQYVEAVEQATAETNAGRGPSEAEMDEGGGSAAMGLAPFVALAAVGAAYAYADGGAPAPAAGPLAFLARAFPREARVLGFAT